MTERSIQNALVRVWRGAVRDQGHFDDFVVPYEEGAVHRNRLYLTMHQSARTPSFQLIFFPSA